MQFAAAAEAATAEAALANVAPKMPRNMPRTVPAGRRLALSEFYVQLFTL